MRARAWGGSPLGDDDQTARRGRAIRSAVVAGICAEEPQTDPAQHPAPLGKGELLEAKALLHDPRLAGRDDQLRAIRHLRPEVELALLQHESLRPCPIPEPARELRIVA